MGKLLKFLFGLLLFVVLLLVAAAVIIPLVPNYPDDKLELISSEYLKQSLSLQDGDEVEVIVYI